MFSCSAQVEERDKEIERLNRALDGGRPHDVISLEAQNISNEKLIAHLNLQVNWRFLLDCMDVYLRGLIDTFKQSTIKNSDSCRSLLSFSS